MKKAWIIPMVLAAGTMAGSAARAANVQTVGHPPLLDGGFWQMGTGILESFTDEELAAEVGYFKDLGLNILMIQYSARWDPDAKTYYAYVPNPYIELDPAFKGRAPFEAIFAAADRHGVRIILGGLLSPYPREVHYHENIDLWTSPTLMAYRQHILKTFSSHLSLYGYYTPNEPNPRTFLENDLDLQPFLDATAEVLDLVRKTAPNLTIVHSIGLYNVKTAEGGWAKPPVEFLDDWWRPWVRELDEVDVWMIIDGVGTQLSDFDHTDAAQAWGRRLAHEFGKQFWVDVENAWMGNRFEPFDMDTLARSLEIAARHGDRLVTFDYIHYMSRQSPKDAARALHEAYRTYRMSILKRGPSSTPTAGPTAQSPNTP